MITKASAGADALVDMHNIEVRGQKVWPVDNRVMHNPLYSTGRSAEGKWAEKG